MELWQALLIMVIGVDVVIQFCRWIEERSTQNLLRQFSKSLNSNAAEEIPTTILSIMQNQTMLRQSVEQNTELVRGDLRGQNALLRDVYQLVDNRISDLAAMMKKRKK